MLSTVNTSIDETRSQDRIWGVAKPPKSGPFGPKSGLFEPHALNPPKKPPFLAHFVAKSGPFSRFFFFGGG